MILGPWWTVEALQILVYVNVMCLKKAESSFEIEIPKELIPKLTIFQKVYT